LQPLPKESWLTGDETDSSRDKKKS